MGVIEFIKAIPVILQIGKAIYSFIKHMQEQKHDNAMSKLDRANTKEEAKDALNDLSKNP